MKNILAIGLFLISVNGNCQKDTLSTKKKIIQVGAFYSSDYFIKKALDNTKYLGEYSSTFGINFTRKIKKKSRIDIGLQFSSWNYRKEELVNGIAISPGNIIDVFYTTYYKDRSFELPIKYNYFIFQKRKLNFYLLAGLNPSFLYRSITQLENQPINGEIILEPKQISNAKSIYSVTFSSTIGVGLEYQLKNNLSVSLQPEFRTKMIYSIWNYQFYRFGVNFGVRYNF